MKFIIVRADSLLKPGDVIVRRKRTSDIVVDIGGVRPPNLFPQGRLCLIRPLTWLEELKHDLGIL